MLSFERLVGQRLELGTVDGTLEELNKGLPITGTILTKSNGKLLLEVERVCADGSIWWSIGTGGRAQFSGDVNHDGALELGVALNP